MFLLLFLDSSSWGPPEVPHNKDTIAPVDNKERTALFIYSSSSFNFYFVTFSNRFATGDMVNFLFYRSISRNNLAPLCAVHIWKPYLVFVLLPDANLTRTRKCIALYV